MGTTQTGFIPGLDLSEAFHSEIVQPILTEHFPDLRYSAALIGSGSEVLGFDTEMSADHHWGPRVMLFMNEAAVASYGPAVKLKLSKVLPRRFSGYPTSFVPSTAPDDNGVMLLEYSEEGPVNHRVEMTSLKAFFHDYLSVDIDREISAVDWLTFPQQKLLSITAGRIFHDEAGLADACGKFAYYPHDVWLYLLACGWARIEQEEHLMGRAGFVGDELGSAIIAGRLVRDLMQLCFLMEKRYAPYSKWYGTAFKNLACADTLLPILQRVLLAEDWKTREKHLCQAYEYVASLHNKLSVTALTPSTVSHFHGRPFLVISKGSFSKAILECITDPVVKAIATRAPIGSVDQFSDSTDLLCDPSRRAELCCLY